MPHLLMKIVGFKRHFSIVILRVCRDEPRRFGAPRQDDATARARAVSNGRPGREAAGRHSAAYAACLGRQHARMRCQ